MNTEEFKFQNGDTLEDIVTGFKGIVMVKAVYSTGCTHYGLSPKVSGKGEISSWEWLDQSRLKLIKDIKRIDFNIIEGSTSGPEPCGPES